MGCIGSNLVPVFLDPLPWEVPRPYRIITRPGMSAASVLFYAKQYPPMRIRTQSTAASRAAAMALCNTYLALRRKAVKFDDGNLMYDGTVILDFSALIEDVGLTIGGNAVGDRWQITGTWDILIDADKAPQQ